MQPIPNQMKVLGLVKHLFMYCSRSNWIYTVGIIFMYDPDLK